MPAFLPECQCGRGGTSYGIAGSVRASCVLTGRPFPGARHGDRVRDIAESEHALLRVARAARAAHPGRREDYKRYRPSVERSSLRLPAAAGGASDSATSAPSRTTPGSSTAPPPSTRAISPAVAWPATTGHGHWPDPARRHQTGLQPSLHACQAGASRKSALAALEARPSRRTGGAIELTGRIRGGDANAVRRRAGELIEAVDIGEWAHTIGQRLSGGVKRLAGFAMVMVWPGRAVILEEPANDVDPLLRRLLWAYPAPRAAGMRGRPGHPQRISRRTCSPSSRPGG